MTLLLDTHTFLWFWWDDPQLSAAAKADIVNPLNRKLISTASEANDKGGPTMSSTVTLEEAQARLAELIGQLAPGDEIVITREQLPVAKLVSSRPPRQPRQPGNCKGMLTIISDDDEH